MSNLKENNLHVIRTRLNKDEYWDLFVNNDSFLPYDFNGDYLYDNCLISYIDMCDADCTDGSEWIYSKKDYQWESAFTVSHTMNNISYTGLDNGLFKFRRDMISNKDFVNHFKNDHYEIEEGDNRLKLHTVSGISFNYEYPVEIEPCQAKLNGGFFQGFFKTECDKYEVLPSRLESGIPWEFEFVLKKCELEPESNKTLNDKYPENKGIFFYMGTRSENKWVYLYDNKFDDTDCQELGYGDYVEGGDISPNEHIINNFFDPNPDDFMDEFMDIDNYTNFEYYDDSLYKYPEGEIGLDGFVEYEDIDKSRFLLEKMDCFCCGDDAINKKEPKKKKPAVSRVFFIGCQCCRSCGCVPKKKKKEKKPEIKRCGEYYTNDLIFGDSDGYISDFDGLDYDTDYLEPEMDISNFEYYTDNDFSLKSANDSYFYTDNKFILFDRTCTGFTVNNWVEGTKMMLYSKKSKFKGNLFILMNRTCTGYTVNNIDKLRDEGNNVYDNTYDDIYDNAFALRITDKGEIGYRMITYDCDIEGEDKTSVLEGYSNEDVIPECEWCTIHVRVLPMLSTMKLYFYVNGKLVYITKELPKLNLRKLSEMNEKQEGVPFNMSIGGGTQGLAETVMPNYMLDPYHTFPIEKNFAGSFIGYFKSFRFYNCAMEYGYIQNNFKYETHLLGI